MVVKLGKKKRFYISSQEWASKCRRREQFKVIDKGTHLGLILETTTEN